MNTIIKFDELLSRLSNSMTEIQVKEAAKKIIGDENEVEINGCIVDISSTLIVRCKDNVHVYIQYSKDNFYYSLQPFHKGDMVKIVAKIKPSIVTYYNRSLDAISLDLISIKQENSETTPQPEIIHQVANSTSTNQNSNGGCFIATVCYGNYDAPEVLIFRQYRDDKLLKTTSGRIGIRFYYAVSPFIAAVVAKSDLMKVVIRKYFLVPILTKIKKNENLTNITINTSTTSQRDSK